MGLLDTFSKKFGFTTEEDDENEIEIDEEEIDEEDEEDDEEEESAFSFRFPTNLFRRSNSSVPASGKKRSYAQENEADEEPHTSRPGKAVRNNVIHDPRMTAQTAEPVYRHCERIVCVRQIEECREIIKCLLRGESVLLNLENADPKDCGRVVDLLSGAAFALQGRMIKVAHLSYLLAPDSVEVVEGDIFQNPQVRYR